MKIRDLTVGEIYTTEGGHYGYGKILSIGKNCRGQTEIETQMILPIWDPKKKDVVWTAVPDCDPAHRESRYFLSPVSCEIDKIRAWEEERYNRYRDYVARLKVLRTKFGKIRRRLKYDCWMTSAQRDDLLARIAAKKIRRKSVHGRGHPNGVLHRYFRLTKRTYIGCLMGSAPTYEEFVFLRLHTYHSDNYFNLDRSGDAFTQYLLGNRTLAQVIVGTVAGQEFFNKVL